MEGFSIVELAVPNSFIGKSIKELQLRYKYEVQVVAVKEVIPERITSMPKPEFIIKDSDILVIMGSDEDLEKVTAIR